MSSTPLKTYDLNSVFLVIGGRRIGGFGEDGGIEFEFSTERGEMAIIADGQATFSQTNNNLMFATVTVMETSKSYRDLADLYTTQAAEAPKERLNFLMEDELSGDKVTDQYAVFIAVPAPSKGRVAGEREFRIALPNAGDPTKLKLGQSLSI